jgi:signal transduction histidine kinase
MPETTAHPYKTSKPAPQNQPDYRLVHSGTGMTTEWEAKSPPIMASIYVVSAITMLLKPIWFEPLVMVLLTLANIHQLGGLQSAARDGTGAGMYSMASLAQLSPMIYLGAFIALQKRAAATCWFLYSNMVAVYLVVYGLGPTGHILPADKDQAAHMWFSLLFTHPCYIVALQYISTLRGRLRKSELKAQAEKERFLAMLSHEIRSPLQAMLGSIDLLSIKVQGNTERRAVERLRQAASQLDTHLRDVTEYSRMDAPSWQLHVDTVNVPELISQTCETWEPQVESRGLALHMAIDKQDETQLRTFRTDASRLRQILTNLLSNALKYTASGHITIHAGLEADGKTLRLEVIDTGIGIPEALQARIFEPYVRLEDKRVPVTEGSGLGLAVVQGLVERLGGQLKLSSKPDEGSRFCVILPSQA